MIPVDSAYDFLQDGKQLLRKLVFHIRNRFPNAGKCLAHFRLCIAALHQRLIVPVERLGRLVVLIGQGLHDELVPLALRSRRRQFGVKLILRDAHPVQRVRQGAGDLAHLRRLIGGFDQSLNGEGIAEGAAHTCGDLRPGGDVLLALGQLCQELGCLRGGVRVAQNPVKSLVCLLGRVRAVPRRLKGGIQPPLRSPVFLGGFIQVPQAGHQVGHSGGRRLDAGGDKVAHRHGHGA